MIDLSTIHRALMSMIQIGTIDEVQADPLRYRVTFDEQRKSWWLRHGERRALKASSWDPYEKGEQVLCLLPGGNWDGVIICAIHSDQNPQPESDLDKFVRDMKDGARIEYDSNSHSLKATLPNEGTVELVAKGGFLLDGPLEVTEDITSHKEVRDKKGTMQLMRDQYNGHVNGNSPPPDPQM
ncbi:phage baseplate assembly protein V [Thalassotalea sp. G20_0]|uniref:phage baseplate assembly protein V n=1 Tax=Thalassotalea sp. G20_0 TaxID=2821093 RepID=UPI001ADBEB28|nr:phage baseplate assembly protein V [Thalassotalea sp. G20_0]MBO9493852.1 phage baseplate assembly protein V [Thalassotalea sp. G20_0]